MKDRVHLITPTYLAANEIANNFFDRLQNITNPAETDPSHNQKPDDIKPITDRALQKIELLKLCKTLEKPGQWNSEGGDLYPTLLSIYLKSHITIYRENKNGENVPQKLLPKKDYTENISLRLKNKHYTYLEELTGNEEQNGENTLFTVKDSDGNKYRYREVDVDSDGNCLFHCVKLAKKELKEDHEALRKALAENIRKNPEKYEPIYGYLLIS